MERAEHGRVDGGRTVLVIQAAASEPAKGRSARCEANGQMLGPVLFTWTAVEIDPVRESRPTAAGNWWMGTPVSSSRPGVSAVQDSP